MFEPAPRRSFFNQFYGTWTDAAVLRSLGLPYSVRRAGRPLRAAPPAGYTSPAALRSAFAGLASTYPSLAQVVDLTAAYGTPLTHDGNRMYALKISDNVAADEDEPNYLVVSNHHARELMTPELALNTSASILAKYAAGDDAAVRALVDGAQVYVIWTQNPDGLEYVWAVDDLWRKNRRNNGNSYGVDQNRCAMGPHEGGAAGPDAGPDADERGARVRMKAGRRVRMRVRMKAGAGGECR